MRDGFVLLLNSKTICCVCVQGSSQMVRHSKRWYVAVCIQPILTEAGAWFDDLLRLYQLTCQCFPPIEIFVRSKQNQIVESHIS